MSLCPELAETRAVLLETNDIHKLSADYNDPILFEGLLKLVRKIGKSECFDKGLHRFFPILETEVHKFLDSNQKYHGDLGRVFYTLCNQHLIMGILKNAAAEFRLNAEEKRNAPSCPICVTQPCTPYALQEHEEDYYLKVIRDVWVESQTMCRERGLMSRCRAEVEHRLSRLTTQLSNLTSCLQQISIANLDIHKNGDDFLRAYQLSLAVINVQHKVMIYKQLSKIYKGLSPSQDPLTFTTLSGWLEPSPNCQVLVKLNEGYLTYPATPAACSSTSTTTSTSFASLENVNKMITLDLTEFTVRSVKREACIHLIKDPPKKVLLHSKSSSNNLLPPSTPPLERGDTSRRNSAQSEVSSPVSKTYMNHYTRLPVEPPFVTFRVLPNCRFDWSIILGEYLPEGIYPIVELYATPECEEVLDIWTSKILQNIRMAKLVADTKICIEKNTNCDDPKDVPTLLTAMMAPHFQALEAQKQELSFLWARRLQEIKQDVDEVSYALEILSKQREIIRTMNFSHQRLDIVQQALDDLLAKDEMDGISDSSPPPSSSSSSSATFSSSPAPLIIPTASQSSTTNDNSTPVSIHVTNTIATNSTTTPLSTNAPSLSRKSSLSPSDSALPTKVIIPVVDSTPEVTLDPYLEFPYARVKGVESDNVEYYQLPAFVAVSSRRNSYSASSTCSACGCKSEVIVPAHDHLGKQEAQTSLKSGGWVRVLRRQGDRCLCVPVSRSGEYADGRELWKSSFRLSILDVGDLEFFPWLGELRKKLDGKLRSSVSLFIENYATYLSNRSYFHQKSRMMRDPLASRTSFEVSRFALSLDDHLLHLGFGCFRASDFVDLSVAETRLNKLVQAKQEVFLRAAEKQKNLGERFVECNNLLVTLKQKLHDEKDFADVSFEQCKLPLACLKGDVEWTKTQLQSMSYDKKRCKAFVNQPSKSGHYPLLIASQGGYLDVVDSLIEAGCNPLVYDKHRGWAALHYASMQGHLDVVKRLVNLEITEQISDTNDTLFGFIKSPKGLKSPNKDNKLVIQRKDFLNLRTEETGDSVLHIAVCFRRHHVVEWLLANAADPNIQASAELRQSVAPLHDAARLGDTRSTVLLISYGASVTLRIPTPMDLDPSSVFLIALCHQHQGVVDVLVAQGYGLSSEDQNRLVEWCRSTGHHAPLDILSRGYQAHIEGLRQSLKPP